MTVNTHAVVILSCALLAAICFKVDGSMNVMQASLQRACISFIESRLYGISCHMQAGQ